MRADAVNYQPFWVVVAKLAEAEGDRAQLLEALEKASALATDDASPDFIARWVARVTQHG